MNPIREAIIFAENERLNNLLTRDFSDFDFVEPDEVERQRLKHLIISMDIPEQNLLFFVYGYGHSFEELEDLFNIEHAQARILYISSCLAELLAYEDKFISEKSLKEVSIEAMREMDASYLEENTQAVGRPIKSLAKYFRIPRNRFAGALASCLVLVFLFLGANALANGKIFKFILEKYEQYSSFLFDGEENREALSDFTIDLSYIPEDFLLEKTEKILENEFREYSTLHGDKLFFVINRGNYKSNLDTEEAHIEELEIEGEKAYLWERRSMTYLVSSKNSIPYEIYGKISREEIIRMAENIKIVRE